MPLQGSGQITLNDIATFFGGSAQHGLSEYYRGGANVPDIAANSNIPTSGQIKLTDFYNADDSTPLTSVTVNTTSPTGACNYNSSVGGTECTANSVTVTATPVGGTTYSYLWEKVSGTTLIVNSSSSASTTFTATSNQNSSPIIGTYRCRVISDGVTKYSPNVTIQLSFIDIGQ